MQLRTSAAALAIVAFAAVYVSIEVEANRRSLQKAMEADAEEDTVAKAVEASDEDPVAKSDLTPKNQCSDEDKAKCKCGQCRKFRLGNSLDFSMAQAAANKNCYDRKGGWSKACENCHGPSESFMPACQELKAASEGAVEEVKATEEIAKAAAVFVTGCGERFTEDVCKGSDSFKGPCEWANQDGRNICRNPKSAAAASAKAKADAEAADAAAEAAAKAAAKAAADAAAKAVAAAALIKAQEEKARAALEAKEEREAAAAVCGAADDPKKKLKKYCKPDGGAQADKQRKHFTGLPDAYSCARKYNCVNAEGSYGPVDAIADCKTGYSGEAACVEIKGKKDKGLWLETK